MRRRLCEARNPPSRAGAVRTLYCGTFINHLYRDGRRVVLHSIRASSPTRPRTPESADTPSAGDNLKKPGSRLSAPSTVHASPRQRKPRARAHQRASNRRANALNLAP